MQPFCLCITQIAKITHRTDIIHWINYNLFWHTLNTALKVFLFYVKHEQQEKLPVTFQKYYERIIMKHSNLGCCVVLN